MTRKGGPPPPSLRSDPCPRKRERGWKRGERGWSSDERERWRRVSLSSSLPLSRLRGQGSERSDGGGGLFRHSNPAFRAAWFLAASYLKDLGGTAPVGVVALPPNHLSALFAA